MCSGELEGVPRRWGNAHGEQGISWHAYGEEQSRGVHGTQGEGVGWKGPTVVKGGREEFDLDWRERVRSWMKSKENSHGEREE